jgi:hypothetical protein
VLRRSGRQRSRELVGVGVFGFLAGFMASLIEDRRR